MINPRYKFYFDGVLIQDPIGWDSLTTSIKRDASSRGIIIAEDATLAFVGDGYSRLRTKFKEDGFCSSTKIDIYESCQQDGQYELYYTGLIFTTDIEFDLKKCVAKTKIQDNSYYAKINNNKSIKANPTIGKSKNGVDIDPAPIEQISLFIPSTGAYTYGDISAIRLFELFRFYIDFMSDGTIGFESSVLDSGGEFEGIFATTGAAIANISTPDLIDFNAPKSYIDFFTTISKLLNLGWWIEKNSAGYPVFRIEKADFFYSSFEVLELNKVNGIMQRFDQSKMYANLKIGSQDINDDPAELVFPELIDFLGFKDEEYIILGECNIDASLDLTTSLIISSNVIESIQQLVTGGGAADDSHEHDWVLIDVNVGTMQAVQSNWLTGAPPYYYNERLNNDNVAARYLGAVPSSIAQWLTDVDVLFSAGTVEGIPMIIPNAYTDSGTTPADHTLRFSNEGTPYYDPDNVWDNSTFKFRAPIGGIYQMRVHIRAGIGDDWDIQYMVFDESNTLYSITSNGTVTYIAGVQDIDDAKSVYIPAGYTMEVHLVSTGAIGVPWTLGIYDTSYIICEGSTNGNGIVSTYDPSKYPVIIYEFNYPISDAQRKLLKANANRIVKFNDGKHNYQGWIESVSIKNQNGMTKFTLLTSERIT